MFQNLKLNYTILGFLIIFSIVPVLALAYFSFYKSEDTINQQILDQLVFARETKSKQVTRKLEAIRNEARLLASMPWTRSAMQNFSQSFQKLANEKENYDKYKNSLVNFYGHIIKDKFRSHVPDQIKSQLDLFSIETLYLQYHYLINNPYIMDYKSKLEVAEDNSLWSQEHAKYHSLFLNYMNMYHYSDIFLVDINTNNVVYSCSKKIDFGMSLDKGILSGTLLEDGYQIVRVSSDKNLAKITDMEKYLPSYGFPANFVATPIFNGEQKIGVLIMQISSEQISQLVDDNDSFCESYLVGDDYFMRSVGRQLLDSPINYHSNMKKMGMTEEELKETKSKMTTILIQKVNTPEVKKAFLGNNGAALSTSYSGFPVINAYGNINDPDLNWVLVSEKKAEDSFVYIRELQKWLFFATGVAVFLILICGYFLTSRVTTNINNTIYSLSDELWQFQGQVQNIGQSLESIYLQQGKMVKQVEEKLSLLNAMSSVNFDNTKEANKLTHLMSHHVKESIHNMNNVMNSINNIGVHTQETGAVLELIDDIAKETHVVSVNASIRAAHEQNESFSMVASEVRKLAFKSSDAVHKTDANIKLAKGLAQETSQTANYTAKSLHDIQNDIKKTISILEEISLASQEQFNDLQGVSEFVDNICYSQEVLGEAVLKTSEVASMINLRITGIVDGLKSISQGQKAS